MLFVYLLFAPFFLSATGTKPLISGCIKNYNQQNVFIYKCYEDTELLIDSTKTDTQGGFIFTAEVSKKIQNLGKNTPGIYKIMLQSRQYLYIILDDLPISLSADLLINDTYRSLTNLKFLKSKSNQLFLEFQTLQNKFNVATYYLANQLQSYPPYDPFYTTLEEEYKKRVDALYDFANKNLKGTNINNSISLLIRAYHQPEKPNWSQTNEYRKSLLTQHFFDYFNPLNTFYLNSTILPQKIDEWFSLWLSSNETFEWNEQMYKQKAIVFLEECFNSKKDSLNNNENAFFILNYILKKAHREHFDNALLYLYDNYTKRNTKECNLSNSAFDWASNNINSIRNIQIGNSAPDFEIKNKNVKLSTINANYTLLVFWASWCGHCAEFIPQLKKAVDNFNANKDQQNKIEVVSISIDNKEDVWQKYISDNKLVDWINCREEKGIDSELARNYNIRATPSIFLLDKNKKIIAKPEGTPIFLQKINDGLFTN